MYPSKSAVLLRGFAATTICLLALSQFFSYKAIGEVNTEEEGVLASLPPANLEPTTACNTKSFDQPEFSIGGQLKTYRNSSEVRYSEDGWEKRIAVEWEGLNRSILGYPGINVPARSPTPDSIDANVRIAVIDIRNVRGIPHYFYLSNSTAEAPIENWSSTKVIGVIGAAHYLRQLSNQRVGLNSYVNDVPLGRYITSIGENSDNPTAAWFKTVMGPSRLSQFYLDWIGKSDYRNRNGNVVREEFASGYGSRPANYGGENPIFEAPTGESIRLRRDTRFSGANTLAPISLAETWKRVLVNKRDPSYQRQSLKISEKDLEVMLYGEKADQGFGGFLVGGAKEIFVEALGGKNRLDRLTNGKWRMFGKTGSGSENSRNRAEQTLLMGLCLPSFEGGIRSGRELVFFMNVQSKSIDNAKRIRLEVISKLARYLIPELDI